MTNVYITNYNLKKITGNVRTILPEELLLESIPLLNELKPMFSYIELSRFLFINAILNDNGELLDEYFGKYKETNIKGSAYHISAKCRELNKNFLDIYWDESDRSKVSKLESDLIIRYQDLIYDDIPERKLTIEIPADLIEKYNASDAKAVIRKNSGHLAFSNVTKEDVIEKIKLILSDSNDFRYSSDDDVKDEIKKYTYGTDRWIVVKSSETMEKWKGFKDVIADLIIAYFRISSSSNISDNLLDSLKLNPCRSCMASG